MLELELPGSPAEVDEIVLEGGYSTVEIDSSGGGYGLLELEEIGNSEESVAPGVLEGGYSMLVEDVGRSVVG